MATEVITGLPYDNKITKAIDTAQKNYIDYNLTQSKLGKSADPSKESVKRGKTKKEQLQKI